MPVARIVSNDMEVYSKYVACEWACLNWEKVEKSFQSKNVFDGVDHVLHVKFLIVCNFNIYHLTISHSISDHFYIRLSLYCHLYL